MIRVYIKVFDASGVYESDFREITNDCILNNIGTISESISNSDYETGTYKTSDFQLKVINRDGLYSNEVSTDSIFQYKRSDSIVRVTWTFQEFDSKCGMVQCGNAICNPTEFTVFEGLLNDEATTEDTGTETISFRVLGYQTLFKRTIVNYSSLSLDTVKNTIYAMLNQSTITSYLTVDLDNINPDINEALDSIDDLENKTVDAALKDLLDISNSVLRIKNNTVYVSLAEESATLNKTFYGQASTDGTEDIVKISTAKNGLSRTFNYISWADTSYFKQETTSIDKYLVKTKELNYSYLSSQGKIESVLQGILDAFSYPKREFDLTTYLTKDTIILDILDKVNVDYPTPLSAPVGKNIAVYGVAEYGTDVYPFRDLRITIDSTDRWKILAIKKDFKNQQITYKLREV